MEIIGVPRPDTRGQQSIAGHYVDDLDQRRRQLLKGFSHKMKVLLTESDQDYLLAALKEYQMYNQIDKLIHCLRAVLDTPAKLDLLRDVRHFISPAHLARYDTLVPYHRMAHPWMLSGVATMPRSRKQRINVLTTPQQTPKMKPRMTNGFTESLASEHAPLKVISLVKDESELLGFSIRGGSEHGLGIFVSEVEPGTPAEEAGLVAGDNIIEVNSVSFDSIASSSAVKVLTGSQRLKMIVRRVNKIPDFRSAKEKISWYDVHLNRIIEGNFEDHGMFHLPPGVNYTEIPDRAIALVSPKGSHQFLGFNIRGGSEYGLGIYVSKVDAGGLAEECGLQSGDLIVEVNGHSFLKVTHTKAVDAVRSQRQLMLTVRDVGKYPAFKEIFAEYRWLDTLTGTISKTRSTGNISSVPVRTTTQHQATHQLTEFPSESYVQSYAQTDNESDEELEIPVSHQMEAGFISGSDPDVPKHLLPQRSDIELRRKPYEEVARTTIKNSPGRLKEKTSARPTLAVKAMEMETRAKYPELAEQLDKMSEDQRAALYDRAYLDLNNTEAKSRSFKDILFGSKSGSNEVKSSSQGARPSNNRIRKPLTGLNFMKKNGDDDKVLCFESGLSSQLMGPRHKCNIALVEESARRRLANKDEINAVLRHIKTYEKEKNLNQLLNPLLAILDTHEKLQLLRDIRSEILPTDLQDYDRTVVSQEQLRLRQEAIKQSPRRQMSPSKQGRWRENNPSVISPGRKPLYKSTREVEYKKDIEAQQQQQKEQEKRKFAFTRSGYEVSASSQDKQNQSLQAHKAGLNAEASELNSEPDSNHRSRDFATGLQPFSGPFLEDLDSHDYCDIKDIDKARSLNKAIPGSQSHAGGPAIRLSQSTTSVNNSPTPNSPVYATVNKPDRKSSTSLPDLSYIESNTLYGVYENMDLPEADAQLVHQGTESQPNTSKTDDFWDSQSETYQEAKKALNFLDALDTEEDDDDDDDEEKQTDKNSSAGPQSSLWSSCPDTPRSEVSSLAESRFGSYDVSTSVPSSPQIQNKSANDRSPPRFIPPPPPDSPPPDDLEQLSGEQQNYIAGIRYTKRQHSYDKETFLEKSFGALPSRGLDRDECAPPVPSRSNLSEVDSSDSHQQVADHSRDPDDTTRSTTGAGIIEIVLRKTHASLGFSISGGSDSKTQPDIRVDQVFPGGAAMAEGSLKAGMLIISVDDHSLQGVTHRQAVDIIRKTFSNKQSAIMTLRVKRCIQF